MRWRTLVAIGMLAVAAPAVTSEPQSPQPILILISFDGWRWDYTDRADAPNLRALAKQGVRSEGLIPVFPSKTFPNHYSIVTGLYPEAHGIVSNNMWDWLIGERFSMRADTARDSRWWGGEPLWVTAIRQGRRSASMFWPGSEVEIRGVRPSEWQPYQDKLPHAQRIWQVLEWLDEPEAQRPSFITLYFSVVDTAGHNFGPDAPETLAAASALDRDLGELLAGIAERKLTDRVNIIVAADHGMSQLALDRKIFIDDYIDPATVEVVEWTPVLQVIPRTGTVDDVYRALRGRHPALDVYKRESLPAELRYSSHPRIAPVIGLAADGWAITTRARFEEVRNDRRQSGGDHGYVPSLRSMHALFVADGPVFRDGLTIPAFENVHLYELMCRVLGLRPAANDGDLSVTRQMLR